mgnify:CR=1 FL=1
MLTGGAATQTTAGTYAVTADFVPTDTTNYNTLTGLAAGDFVINKAATTTTVTCADATYTGAAQTTCTATTTGVGGLSVTDTVSYTNNTNVGTAKPRWTVNDAQTMLQPFSA